MALLATGVGATTLVGCLGGIPGGKQHGANTAAIEMADQARIRTSDGDQPQQLTLLSAGAVVAVYVAKPVRADY